MTILTILVLVVALIAAARLDVDLSAISWLLMSTALLVSLVSPLLSAAEYRLTMRLTGYQSDWRTALQVSVYGSIANTLPLPGGVALKLKAMTEQGARAKRAIAASILTGLIWLSLSAAALAIALPDLRVVTLLIAFVLFAVAALLAASARFPLAAVANISLVEGLFVLSSAMRFLLCLTAVGLAVTIKQAVGLSASGPVASAIGLVPAGLGVYETISAGIALVIGLTASAGFLGAVILRVLGFVGLLAWIPLIQSGYFRRAE